MSLYRIWYSDGNDRTELGRVTAQDIDKAIEYAKKEYLKKDTEIHSEDGDPDFSVYLMINVCKGCEYEDCLQCDPEPEMDINRESCRLCNKYDMTPCEDCERSEYLEIQLDNDADPEYKTIMGTNEYADLNTDTRPNEHDPILAQAWRDSPEKGVAQLILSTIDNNPHLREAYSEELIENCKGTTEN